jgi:mono/diheme cytochrome c family protein
MRRVFTLLCVAFVLAAAERALPADRDGAALFEENCSTCHTIGEGDSGAPDLKGIMARRDRHWLIEFIRDPEAVVKRGDPYAVALVERYDGMVMPAADGLDHHAIEAILAYVEKRSGGLAAAPAAATTTPVTFTAEDIARGQALYAGRTRLERAGPACVSCHDAGATRGFGGGTLGPGLARVSERLNGPRGVATWLGAPPTSVMRSVYRRAPLEPEEARTLAAFFADRAASGAVDRRPRYAALPLMTFGLAAALIAFAGVGVIWRERFRGVRRPLVSGTLDNAGERR